MSATAKDRRTLDAGPELDALVCELMEPRPEPISAWNLRASNRDWQWVSHHMHASPGGWWQAQIGTDHGPAEMDREPVRWVPAREPSTDMAAAWQVVEWARAHFSRWGAFAEWLKHEVSRGLTDGQTVQDAWVWRLVQPEHICRAALAMRPRPATPALAATEAR